MNLLVQQIAREYEKELSSFYGDDLAELILFGSYPHGVEHNESDLDFAVVLRNNKIKPSTELFTTAPISARLSLKYGVMISTIPVSLHQKETSDKSFYRNIRKEGIRI